MNMWIATIALFAVALGAVLIAAKWRTFVQPSQGEATNRPKIKFVIFAVPLLALIAAAGWFINHVNTEATVGDEVQMGLLVVAAIATLMTVLFIVAAGFSSMKLTDSSQPLGLPEGSVRAMIALVLIMVFIIFGIYMFRITGAGSQTYLGAMSFEDMRKLDPKASGWKSMIVARAADIVTPLGKMSSEDMRKLDPKASGWKTIIVKELKDGSSNVWSVKESDYYNVSSVIEIGDDGRRLAQQLITTVGTLVVAVAGFYFGSSATKGPINGRATPNPVIKDVTPREGEKGKQIDLKVVGSGFASAKGVRLVRGAEEMVGTDVISNDTRISCKLTIDKEPDGKWDLLVENEDGKQARLAEVFTIKLA